ncbi:MAG: XdhC family protein [Phycisphaerae bacterium]|nr:XdhC family protein [Phycisphaerae bacterium]
MDDLRAILTPLITDVSANRPVALCIVLEQRGSAPQRPGAAMMVRPDGTTLGTVGGGSGEAEVRGQAVELLKTGQPTALSLDLDQEHGWDDAQICGGQMLVGIVPITNEQTLAPFGAASKLVQQRQPATVPITIERDSHAVEYRINLPVPPKLLIAGAGHVGQAVSLLAATLDFQITVIDDRADIAAPANFPASVELLVGDITATLRNYPIDSACYIVIVTRGHQHDQDALAAVIHAPAAYVGMMGSKRKSASVLAALERTGVKRELLDTVHTPIGLPIGSATLNEIAISIMAEIVQTRRRSTTKVVEGPL